MTYEKVYFNSQSRSRQNSSQSRPRLSKAKSVETLDVLTSRSSSRQTLPFQGPQGPREAAGRSAFRRY